MEDVLVLIVLTLVALDYLYRLFIRFAKKQGLRKEDIEEVRKIINEELERIWREMEHD